MWNTRFAAVPVDSAAKLVYNLVNSKTLNKYGEFYLIDQLVRMYPAYTHEAMANLSVGEVYTIKLMTMENAYLETQRQNVKSQLNKKKK